MFRKMFRFLLERFQYTIYVILWQLCHNMTNYTCHIMTNVSYYDNCVIIWQIRFVIIWQMCHIMTISLNKKFIINAVLLHQRGLIARLNQQSASAAQWYLNHLLSWSKVVFELLMFVYIKLFYCMSIVSCIKRIVVSYEYST